VASRIRLVAALLAVLVLASGADAKRLGVCDAIGRRDGVSRVGILGAFPAELAPLVAAATITDTVVLDGRSYYLGELAGVRVVMALTGIGLVNAEHVTTTMIREFAPRAIVFSGVAGTPGRIGDVAVAEIWRFVEGDAREYLPNLAFLALARAVTDDVVLERCTEVAGHGTVCMEHQTEVTVGGIGESDDPYGGNALPCTPGGDDVFGCDVPGAPAPAEATTTRAAAPAGAEPQYPTVIDMETAAVARVATLAEVPFVAYRGASDGANDPLDLPGFPTQFFAYYRLAAENSAAAATAFLTRLAQYDADKPRICRLLQRKRWKQAAKRIARADAR